MQRLVALLLLILLLAGCTSGPKSPQVGPAPSSLTVAAAANMQPALSAIGKAYEQQTGQTVVFTYGASGNLAKQVEQGAPIDLFIAANVGFVDELEQKGLILPDTKAVYAAGRAVLATATKSGVKVTRLEDLLDPAVKHVAIANPDTAPYGLAAKQALTRAGLWEKVQPKLVYGESIGQTLQFVQTGNADAGILALSLAMTPDLSYALIDPGLYAPLDQALAVVKGSKQEKAARTFTAFLLGPEGRRILEQQGYGLPGRR